MRRLRGCPSNRCRRTLSRRLTSAFPNYVMPQNPVDAWAIDESRRVFPGTLQLLAGSGEVDILIAQVDQSQFLGEPEAANAAPDHAGPRRRRRRHRDLSGGRLGPGMRSAAGRWPSWPASGTWRCFADRVTRCEPSRRWPGGRRGTRRRRRAAPMTNLEQPADAWRAVRVRLGSRSSSDTGSRWVPAAAPGPQAKRRELPWSWAFRWS